VAALACREHLPQQRRGDPEPADSRVQRTREWTAQCVLMLMLLLLLVVVASSSSSSSSSL
jgi:uncharacterized integral membrane protein